MTFEHVIPDLGEWLNRAWLVFLVLAAIVAVVGFLVGFLGASLRRGPVEGFYAVAKVIASAVVDLSHASLRRTLAMAMLAVQEAIRRRVLVAFVVFVLLILFGGWFLDRQSDNPARLYLSFVLTASNYLVVGLALFLSTFSLPADIKNRTIYTIVTKPVRAFEIVIGRILGFSAVGSLLLAGMGIISYIFVVRGLNHSHIVAESAAVTEGGAQWEGKTSNDAFHRHTFRVYSDGTGETDSTMGHFHEVTRDGDDFVVGPPLGMLQARIPSFGHLTFKDRAGADADKGVNVGHEWMYRSYIEGGSLAAAIWTFEGVTPERYPDGFDLELNLRVFRTYKGNIEDGITGTIELHNPNTAARIKRSDAINFTAKEFASDKREISRKLQVIGEDGSVQDGDLFALTDDEGRLEVWIRCGERGQYYGMAERDVYILDSYGSFALNMLKCYIGIWLQMMMVTAFGVMFSTFLSGAVAMLATLASVVIGFFSSFIIEVAAGVMKTGEMEGGGPIESLIRLVTQANLSMELSIGERATAVIKSIDVGLMYALQAMEGLLPNYLDFITTSYVAYGYDISASLVVIQVLSAFAYVLTVSTIAYFILKTRELAA